MRRIVVMVLAGVLCAAAPVGAVNIPGCGDFILFGNTDINFENGTTLITGNVFLRNPTGEVHVGAKNVIHGTITANRIFLGTGAVVDNCVANEIVGTKGTCVTSTVGPGSFNPPAACINAFPPAGVQNQAVNPCVTAAAPLTVPAGQTVDVAANACLGNVILRGGATLRVPAGATINLARLQMDNDSTLERLGAGLPPLINVLGRVLTGPNVDLTHVIVRSQYDGDRGIEVGLSARLEDVLLLAPTGVIHLHSGGILESTSAVADKLAVEPIFMSNPPPPEVCECRPGFHLLNPAGGVCVPD